MPRRIYFLCLSGLHTFCLIYNARVSSNSRYFFYSFAQDRGLVTRVSGLRGVNGVPAASHVTKGGNSGIDFASYLLSALMEKIRKRNLVILTNAMESITSMVIKPLAIPLSRLMYCK